MNSKQLAEEIIDIIDLVGRNEEQFEKLIWQKVIDVICHERTRIKLELKKLDVSQYSAMSLMVKVMDIIGGGNEQRD